MTTIHDIGPGYCRTCDPGFGHNNPEGAASPAALDVHPRTYSLVGGGLDMFLVTDDESGINIGYARKIGGPLTAPIAHDGRIVEAFAFPRNVLISNDHGFMGRWVAIPREDFDRARAEYARLTAEQEEGE